MGHGRPTPDGDTPVERVAVSGAALAALMQAVNSSSGDCDGILFGHVERHTTKNIVDEDMGPQTSQELTAIITGHFCSGRVASFYDSTGRIDAAKLAQMIGERESRGGDAPIGWFIERRGSSMRPSMRETTVTANLRSMQYHVPQDVTAGFRDGKVKDSRELKFQSSGTKLEGAEGVENASIAGAPNSSNSLIREVDGLSSKKVLVAGGNPSSQADGVSGSGSRPRGNGYGNAVARLVGVPSSSPCIFFLFTESSDQNSIHTHEYRAFQYRMKLSGVGCFEPRSIRIVNIGPAFRALYDSFSPVAPFPWFLKSSDADGESPVEGLRKLTDKSSQTTDAQLKGPQEADQALLDMYSQDFSVGRLQSLIRTEGEGGSVRELEALYRTMLRKLDVLAKQVCDGNDAIAEQEITNSKLRAALQAAGKR